MDSLKQPAYPEPSLSYAQISLLPLLLIEVFCLRAIPKDGRVLSSVGPKPAFGVGRTSWRELDSDYDRESQLRR